MLLLTATATAPFSGRAECHPLRATPAQRHQEGNSRERIRGQGLCGMRWEARESRGLPGLVSPIATDRGFVPVPQQMGQHLIFIPKESNKWQEGFAFCRKELKQC